MLQCHDCVPWDMLWGVLWEYGVPGLLDYSVLFQLKEELCLHYLHKFKLVPSAGWTSPGLLFVSDLVDHGQNLKLPSSRI